MTKCESCGADNSSKKQFCTGCGVILPSGTKGVDISKDYDPATAFSKYGADILSGAFAGKAKTPEQEAQPTPSQPKPTATSPKKPATVKNTVQVDNSTSIPTGTRAEVLKTVAKAASKAILKSVALSLAVLGPGFVMLMMGITIPGMVWLFFGSFGLMAWTYRKPWRLGIVSCLMPPAAAGICYIIQLFLFGVASPPALLLLGAIGAGIAVGYWRAQTHEVKQDENGGIIAERTIQYLLVWVAAYGITQFLALIAAGEFAIRAGLITGAFSTAMLAVVSVVIWRQYRTLAIQVAVILWLALTGLIAPIDKAVAQGSSCASMFSQSDRSYRRLKRSCDSDFRKGIRDQALLKILAHKSSGQFAAYKKEQMAERLVSSGGKANLLKAFDVYLQVYRAQVPDNLMLRRSILSKMINLSSKNRSQEMLQRIESIAQEYNALNMRICRAESRGYSGLPKFSREKSNADYCLKRAQAAVARTQQPATQPANNNRTGSESSPKVPGGQKVDPDWEYRPPQPPGSREALIEDSATAAAAIATVLIAAGVAVNVAQAIAAAIANALQAGVQLTSEEIQAAIADAIRNRDSKQSETGSAEPTTDSDSEPESPESPESPRSNAPPNVTSTERIRPPTPIYDENGDPFDTNEQGQYLGPDDKGDWRWLSKSEAQESSAALKGKKSQREGEQAERDRRTEENLERSSQKMRDKDDKTREDERQEREKTQDRRDRINEDAEKEDPRTNPESFPAEYGTLYSGATFVGDWVGGMVKDTGDLITETPGALVDAAAAAATAAAKIATNPENWKAAGRLGADVVGSHFGHQASRERLQERIENAGKFVGKVAAHGIKTALDDPAAAAGAAAGVLFGTDNWRKVVDPNVPITERVGRALWGGVDLGGTIYGPLKGAAGAAGKLGNVLRVGDAAGDAARGAKIADAAADAAKIADKTGDAAATARAADKTADAASAADKTADGARAAREGSKAKSGSLDELREQLANQKRGAVKNPGTGPNVERHGIPGPKTDPAGYVKGLPEGALIDRNLATAGTGYTGHQIDDLARFAKQENVIPGARTTNLDSMRHIRDGKAVPKPLDIKSKTIGNLDTYLGAKPQDKGLVGYFKPTKPDLSKVPVELRADVAARYTQRMEEYNDLRGDVTRLVTEGKVVEKNGKLHAVVREVDGATKHVPYAGDIDGVYFKRSTPPHELIPPGPEYDRLKAAWMGGDKDKGIPNYWTGSNAPGQHGIETNLVADLTKGKTPRTPEYNAALEKAENLHGKLGRSYPKEVIVEADIHGNLRRGLHLNPETNPLPNLHKAG